MTHPLILVQHSPASTAPEIYQTTNVIFENKNYLSKVAENECLERKTKGNGAPDTFGPKTIAVKYIIVF